MSTVSLVKESIFAERYQIVRRIASGGMGAVYEVTHLETNRRRALKVMHPHTLQNEELRERFRNEARVAASIESEFIVDVFDAGVDVATQMPFLVMELLRGEDLGKLLKMKTRLGPGEVLTYLRQIASALDKTHRANIVHRDLKPENIFLMERADGTPWIKILDFGIAKVIAEGTAELGGTRGVGTPLYMAPEQFSQEYAMTPATDLYALGLVTYTLLVGSPYWRDESRRSEGNLFFFASEVLRGPLEPATLRARRAGVELPRAFDGWFAKATALSPRSRFLTAEDMVLALEVALGLTPDGPDNRETEMTLPRASGMEISGAPLSTIGAVEATKPPSTPRGRRWIAGVGAAVGVVALGATGVALLGRPAATAEEAHRQQGGTAPAGELAAPELPPAAPAETAAVPREIPQEQPPDRPMVAAIPTAKSSATAHAPAITAPTPAPMPRAPDPPPSGAQDLPASERRPRSDGGGGPQAMPSASASAKPPPAWPIHDVVDYD